MLSSARTAAAPPRTPQIWGWGPPKKLHNVGDAPKSPLPHLRNCCWILGGGFTWDPHSGGVWGGFGVPSPFFGVPSPFLGSPPFFGGGLPPGLRRVLFFQGNIINQSLYRPLPPGAGPEGAGPEGEWGRGAYSELTRALLQGYSGLRRLLGGFPARLGPGYSGVTPGLLRFYSGVTQTLLQGWAQVTPGLLRLYSNFTPRLDPLHSIVTLWLLQDYHNSTPWLLSLHAKVEPRLLHGYSRVTPGLLRLYSKAGPRLLQSYSDFTPRQLRPSCGPPLPYSRVTLGLLLSRSLLLLSVTPELLLSYSRFSEPAQDLIPTQTLLPSYSRPGRGLYSALTPGSSWRSSLRVYSAFTPSLLSL
ncbi:uncharacterized protein LOC135292377 [Passer domesticus]|uniref:uncharacterized protein LOC135292377 n=1 Tax=Passer domesticus TaxID=48849 RepID=UPI0030FF2B6A